MPASEPTGPLLFPFIHSLTEPVRCVLRQRCQCSVLPVANRLCSLADRLIYNSAMKAKRAAKGVGILSLVALVLLPIPALIAPYISDRPISWAYRAYHPFMYRYPHYFAAVVRHGDQSLAWIAKSRPDQSLEVLKLMIEYY